MRLHRKIYLIVLVLLLTTNLFSQTNRLQHLLDSLRIAGNFPGLSLAVVKADTSFAAVSGYNNKEEQIPLRTSDKMLLGSVGKTYVSAITLQLCQANKLDLDKKVAHYLGHYSWFNRMPNSVDVTVRMLMNHTSGIMRYEFKPQFLQDLTANPGKTWQPEELLQYVLGEKPAFKAGESWDYSDTNYILLGMILEKVTGKKYYDLLYEQILKPLQLVSTLPSDKRKLEGLTQGYAGDANEFGRKNRMVENGTFIINPQFEWTGGGIYATSLDLAQWGKLLYEGVVTDTSLLLSSAVPARLGKDTKYALGVIIRPTALGAAYGHSGFFPGYMTELLYFPRYRMSIAIQCNSSDFKNLNISLLGCLLVIAREAAIL